MERDYEYSVARHYHDLEHARMIGTEAAKKAVKRLNARTISSTRVPIVLDRRVSKNILSYFASAINGESIAKGTSFLKDAMEQSLFNNTINIIADPHLAKGIASKPFDAEAAELQQRVAELEARLAANTAGEDAQ